ncbi:response regulator [Chloroflexota bacterium]
MSKIKILLVEDHMITRQGVHRLLEESDFDIVGEASDGEQAVQLAVENMPDVIIMDIALPKLNGVDATRQIKSLCPGTAILILSAYDDDEYVFSLLDIGVAGYLLKTTSGDELTRAVEAVHNGESILDATVTQKVINRFKVHGSTPPNIKIHETLSSREVEIMKLASKGMTNQEIADIITVSKRTVEEYMRSIFNKLAVGSRTEAVICGLKKGWLALD